MTPADLADRSVDLGEWAATTPNADAVFAGAVRHWLAENLVGDFAALRGRGGPGSEHEFFAERLAWDRHLAAAGWTCLGWPAEHGGRGATLEQRIIFHQEYARANGPARVNHLGEELLGPTLVEFGSSAQRSRFLPGIVNVAELWAQGYSEPGAGSDLAAVATTAVRGADGRWVINGQKIWTSLAHLAQWAFVLVRTPFDGAQRASDGAQGADRRRHGCLSFLLVPLDQRGVTIRPIRQITGTSEFNEVFFDGATTDADLIVGAPGDGWKVATALLQFERGVSTLGQQVGFARELDEIVDAAKANGAIGDPEILTRLRRARVGLTVLEATARRSATPPSVTKLLWGNWHRDLGQLAVDVAGASSLIAPPETSEGRLNDLADPDGVELSRQQRLMLFTRADTIYGGSDQVQRNVIAERILGLPREARR
ncbi:MAG: acyl-CoA dehydrogenase family protein [Gordonia sp. (in: high G+C Gram-positive bacteria)]